jgi:beta-phosphoglucomutase
MFKAVLCDMDGTLIDTEYANASAYCESLKQNGIDIDIQEFISKYSGMSWKEFIPLICLSIDENTSKKIAADKKIIYKTKLTLTKLNQNVVQLVAELKATKKVALVTTASREAVNDLLRYHEITELFDLLITGDDVRDAKPSPEPYLKAADKLAVRIENCIVLEDSSIGIESARKSGATVLIVDHE